MRPITLANRALLAAALPFLAAACASEHKPGLEQRRALNVWLVKSLQDESAENAIIAQKTLFPYHFVEGSGLLNELGHDHLSILAAHYRQHPGHLNLRQGRVPDDIYAARKETVLDLLADAGIDPKGMVIADGLPGGDGADSERVFSALTQEREQSSETTTSGQERGSSTTGASGSATRSSR